MSQFKFDYSKAFARNLGWLTKEEAEILSQKKVAIAGLGGVGGYYCEVLARLGIQKFHIADFDQYEIQNFNRQCGASMDSLGQAKSEVMKNKILSINPLAEIKVFPKGINLENMPEFLNGVDMYLDGLDFYAAKLRIFLFEMLTHLKIPFATVAPIGMGAAFIFFDSQSMSAKKYFGFHPQMSDDESVLSLYLGVTASFRSTRYLVDPSALNFKEKRAPSTPMGPFLCAGIAGTIVLKALLHRGDLYRAPWCIHYDSYCDVLKKKYIWWGYRHPLQQIKKILAKMKLGI